MIKYDNGIVTINFNTHIVLSKVATIDMAYESSMFSDGSWKLKINGVTVYSSYRSEEISEMITFIKSRLDKG